MTLYERRFRLQMTVRERDMQTIFDLLKDVAQDFKMIEIGRETDTKTATVNGVEHTAFQRHRNENTGRWANKLWIEIEPIFRHEHEHGDGMVRYNDKRLADILVKTGNSPHTVTPLLSELRSMGKLERPHRGWYRIPRPVGQ